IVVNTPLVRGQEASVTYTVQNSGGLPFFAEERWKDLIYLSRDEFLDPTTDVQVGAISVSRSAFSGSSYQMTAAFDVPWTLPEDAYHVIVVTDSPGLRLGLLPGSVIEGPENVYVGPRDILNSAASALQEIQTPPTSNLQVTFVTVSPTMAAAGDELTVDWTVTNIGDEPISGTWNDGLFLSADASWSLSDPHLQTIRITADGGSGTITLAPGQSYNRTATVRLPVVSPGDYRVIVRTDILNQVPEGAFEPDNVAASANSISVTAETLLLNVTHDFQMTRGSERLYQIDVAADQTLKIDIQSSREATTTEIYARYDAAPTTAQFDAQYSGRLSADPKALLPSTQLGRYYILVRHSGSDDLPTSLNITVRALPLAITDVFTDVGGDGRYVTTEIRGAQFRDGAIVKLTRPGIAEVLPVETLRVDNSRIVARFDFTGLPHGLYDVEVINPDGARAVVPYRFLIERAVEPEVTIGLGGDDIIAAGRVATYAVTLLNRSNLDAPYTYFQVAAPNLGLNDYIYSFPYLRLTGNVRGVPDGVQSSEIAPIPWFSLDSVTNTTGEYTTSGYLFDQPAGQYSGFTVNVLTYPGLLDAARQNLADLQAALAELVPEAAAELDDGFAGLEGFVNKLLEAFGQSLPDGFTAADVAEGLQFLLTGVKKPAESFIPFRFHLAASATSLTRDEFVQQQSSYALSLRDAILRRDDVSDALVAIAGDAEAWTNLYLSALEEAEILRPAGSAGALRENPQVLSLMAVLAGGILYGPAGTTYQSTGELLTFFENLREWYGSDMELIAPFSEVTRFDLEQGTVGEVRLSDLPNAADFYLGLTAATNTIISQIFAVWPGFDDRFTTQSLQGLVFQDMLPPETAGQQIDFSSTDATTDDAVVSVAAPQTLLSNGYVPSETNLPWSVNFSNPALDGGGVSEVRILVPIDPSLDPYSFGLGGITIGDLQISIPAGRALFSGDYDFSESRGFVLRVSAGIDLYQQSGPVATWTLQAINPTTGQVIDPAHGPLLTGDFPAGSVSWQLQAAADPAPGTEVQTTAAVRFNSFDTYESLPVSVSVDGTAPVSSLNVTRISEAQNTFEVRWNAFEENDGSGFRHITIYMAADGGDFKIWKSQVTDPSGADVFFGEPDVSYEFLALATDYAGNRETPKFGANVADDGSGADVGSLPTFDQSTPVDLGPRADPAAGLITNPLFTLAQQQLAEPTDPVHPAEFASTVAPFASQMFAADFGNSGAGIGPTAIVELPTGGYLIAGGFNRGQLYRFDSSGQGGFLNGLNVPVYGMEFDPVGRLWATTGGGPLVQLDPDSGAAIAAFGDGLTIDLAVHPQTGLIYVTSNRGVEIFSPETETFTQFSRDRNLRFGSLDFDRFGRLWAVTWPDRSQVVRFNDRARAELVADFSYDIDSLSFGKPETLLEDMLFVSSNNGPIGDGGRLSAIDMATFNVTNIAVRGTRGDVVMATSRGELLLSQSHQVDRLFVAASPVVTAVNPPDGSQVPLPLNAVTVFFSQPMNAAPVYSGADDVVSDPGATPVVTGSVLETANYSLYSATFGEIPIQQVRYNSADNSVTLLLPPLVSDDLTLTVSDNIQDANGVALEAPFVTRFQTSDDLTSVFDIRFTQVRSHRGQRTISYDVEITNRTDVPASVPLVLTLDPNAGVTGLPMGPVSQLQGRYLIDLSGALPESLILAPGQTTTAQTISLLVHGQRRADYSIGLLARFGQNQAPEFTSVPPQSVTIGTEYVYSLSAEDPEQQAVIYYLVDGPDGMEIDPLSDELRWTPSEGNSAEQLVTVMAMDSRGAVAIQRFLIDVSDGNRVPQFSLPET
ncbi:MAG: hypothetical protein KDA89_13860, partial [Planctomycetaceae bacterium]|nr:hypothetical protein [Planctomycetaceae bacterium]